MQIGRTVVAAVGLLTLTGCVAPAVIADLEEDKVIVQSGLGTTDDQIWIKAQQGCSLHGRTPIELSVRCVDPGDFGCTVKNHLFACVKK